MNDVLVPRIIVSGLLVVACMSIVASYFEPTATWCPQIINSVVSGLLGYVAGSVLEKK